MLKYDLKFGVSEIAKILDVDRELIKKLAYHFSDYLNPKASPGHCLHKEFSVQDICTLGYALMYWENENTDFDNIKLGLNAREQFDFPYNELAIQAIPIFREYSDDLEGSKVWMIGGCGESDLLSLAESYKKAGDSLINIGIKDEENIELIYPAIFNYRHATELYLKAVLPRYERDHNLIILYNRLEKFLKEKTNSIPPLWFSNIIIAFNDFDSKGTTFRYGTKIEKDEMFIDLWHIQNLMNWFSESIFSIKECIYKNSRIESKLTMLLMKYFLI